MSGSLSFNLVESVKGGLYQYKRVFFLWNGSRMIKLDQQCAHWVMIEHYEDFLYDYRGLVQLLRTDYLPSFQD